MLFHVEVAYSAFGVIILMLRVMFSIMGQCVLMNEDEECNEPVSSKPIVIRLMRLWWLTRWDVGLWHYEMMTIHEVRIRKKDAGVVSGVASIKRIFEDENISSGGEL